MYLQPTDFSKGIKNILWESAHSSVNSAGKTGLPFGIIALVFVLRSVIRTLIKCIISVFALKIVIGNIIHYVVQLSYVRSQMRNFVWNLVLEEIHLFL